MSNNFDITKNMSNLSLSTQPKLYWDEITDDTVLPSQQSPPSAPSIVQESSDPVVADIKYRAFIGNVIYSAHSNDVEMCLKYYGLKPIRAKVLIDKKSGQSKRCAIVHFDTESDLLSALTFGKKKVLKLCGKRLRISEYDPNYSSKSKTSTKHHCKCRHYRHSYKSKSYQRPSYPKRRY